MSTYLFHAFQTPETLAKLLAAPEDRAAVNAPLFKSLGGELLGYWYGLGGVTYYVLRPAGGGWRRPPRSPPGLLPRLSTFPHPCSSTAVRWLASMFT
jgi:hypothetical protein